MALRIGLGFHFLYEGAWKIKHRDEFSAEPFLSQAKGPIAPLFYAMLPDINGRARLQPLKLEKIEVVDPKTQKTRQVNAVRCPWLTDRWEDIRVGFLNYYRPSARDEAAQKQFEELTKQAEAVFGRFKDEVEQSYLPSVIADIDAFYQSLDRFEQHPESHQSAPFQKKRHWDDMMKLRQEARGWINELEQREAVYLKSLYQLLDENQRKRWPVPSSWNPFEWNRLEQINFAVTWSLTLIGVCLLVGFCTPLAALGGAGFMCFVVMTQPAWPGIYPPDPPVVGHALLVNKDFVEMLSLLVVAFTAAGRWGGLDYFLNHLVLQPYLSKRLGGQASAEKSAKA